MSMKLEYPAEPGAGPISEGKGEDKGNGTELPTMHPQEWDTGRFSIQQWFKKTAWHNLKDTRYGVKTDAPPPREEIWTDPLLNQVYKIDLATFIAAEKVSVDCVSSLVRFAPDEVSAGHLATQTLDEARHYEVFCRRMADIGVEPGKRDDIVRKYTTPAMRKFFDLIMEQVDKRDFAAATLALNIILEGMAYPVYRYEKAYWSRFDPGLSQIIAGAFADEITHVGYGEAYIRHACATDVVTRNRILKLAGEFHGLMREVFQGVIFHYIGLYQAAANNHMDLIGDVEIFPGHKMAETSEEEQVRILMESISEEYSRRMASMGLELKT